MEKLLFFAILIVGAFAAHFIAKFLSKKTSSKKILFTVNLATFLIFFVLYFAFVSLVEAQIYGSSAMYDVELIIFVFFGLISSIVSSITLLKARK